MTLPIKQNLFVLNRIFFDFEKFNPLWIYPFENHASDTTLSLGTCTPIISLPFAVKAGATISFVIHMWLKPSGNQRRVVRKTGSGKWIFWF
jgi:hypothetical protein